MIRHRSFLIIGVLVLAGVGFAVADDKPTKSTPTSPAYRDAVTKAARARKDANAIWTRSIVAAKRQEVTDFKAAQKIALAKNDVEEATAIAEAVKQVQAEIGVLSGERITAKVAAGGLWQIVATLPKGTYLVSASGTWTISKKWNNLTGDGVNDQLEGISYGKLVARVNQKLIPIGAKGTFDLDDDATVEMRCWDTDYVKDNSGELKVTIERQ